MWDLTSATGFIREYEPRIAEHGLHIGLTGSILYHGYSTKDLDLIIYPHDTAGCASYVNDPFHDPIQLVLNILHLFPLTPDEVAICSEYSHRVVRTYDIHNRRIDLFFLS